MIKPLFPNLPLLRKVLEHIETHPEEWYQESWAIWFDGPVRDEADRAALSADLGRPLCGTVYCFAGHTVAMTEGIVRYDRGTFGPASGESWEAAGVRLLGVSWEQAEGLFAGCNSLADLRRIVGGIFAECGEVL